MSKCKKCGSVEIVEKEETGEFAYQGNNILVKELFSVCKVCQNEFITTSQIVENDKRYSEARKPFE